MIALSLSSGSGHLCRLPGVPARCPTSAAIHRVQRLCRWRARRLPAFQHGLLGGRRNGRTRRIEDRIDLEVPNRFKINPPSLLICIGWREGLVESMYRRPWRLKTDPDKADYIITTERMNCAENRQLVLIDEVKRFDRAFARTYAGRPQQAAEPSATPAQR